MSTYIIGDVQGCFTELQVLLELVAFNPAHDRLGFVGDLVNRGPDSLQTLRFIKNLENPLVVLGNHDLHLLTIGYGAVEYQGFHTLHDVLIAPDKEELLLWLSQQPLLREESNYLLVHAGIPPQWSDAQALQYSQEWSAAIQYYQQQGIVQLREFLLQIYGNQPTAWTNELTSWERLRYITNALTRMRFCDDHGVLQLTNKSLHSDDSRFRPWYEWYQSDKRILFGHWAALGGCSANPRCIALDTGCAWGNALTAYRLEDGQRFSVPAAQPYAVIKE